jgi:DNA-binding transcriptional LysR family regulator
MTLLQMEYLYEIYNCGSINKASQKLFLTQAGLSHAIKKLEKEMGIEIFIRTNKGIDLTEDGRELLTLIRPILEQHKKISKLYGKNKSSDITSLHISSQRYPFCTKAFVSILNEHSFDKVECSLIETDIEEVINNVASEKSDLGVIFISDLTEQFMRKLFVSNKLEFTELKKIRPHVFIGNHHPLANKNELSINELTEYTYILFNRSSDSSCNYSEEVVYLGSNVFNKTITVTDRGTVNDFLKNSLSFTIGSGIKTEGYSSNKINSIPLADNLDDMRLGYIRLKNSPDNPLVDEFVCNLKEITK